MATITILGANGHIAKGLIFEIITRSDHSLTLYSRYPGLVKSFVRNYNLDSSRCVFSNIANFGQLPSDVIVNTIGAGDPKGVQMMGDSIIKLTKTFDQAVISYLKSNPNSTYIFLSSGAVYGKDQDYGRKLKSSNLPCPQFTPRQNSSYAKAKIFAESLHRKNDTLSIIDLRIFGYFSQFIDLSGDFFMANVVNSIIYKKELLTNPNKMVRDYIIPHDLWNLIQACIEYGKFNRALDVFSQSPIDKIVLLEEMKRRYELHYSMQKMNKLNEDGDQIDIYFSLDKTAQSIGYKPDHSSREGIFRELSKLMQSHKIGQTNIKKVI